MWQLEMQANVLSNRQSEDLGGRREKEKVTTQPLAMKTTKRT